ncbi:MULTISPECIES: nitronate monooxygenase family protein [Paraburkholderia]|uniref:Nitronate monooxygenase n=1 Tax=Paraburkholderia dipogonis TaxID=1211383 RepID=A0A4Y8MH10_9BURK|nr:MULTISPECIES: nitronate monooxygenase family protein [Paraburkholderia]RKR31307.1 NAD(P)H-dependent flavin oxidoreductase YrpB (nitropropane dioxygenase family) [Paraburkholderia sp. BL17N1]TFE36721.1 nitronate monooxygenase [Paraburkholderia dipogonis]
MQTLLAKQLGIDAPIFAFSHCRDVVVEASKAGAIGVLGCVGFTPEELEVQLEWIDERIGGKPYGVDVVMPEKDPWADEADLSRLHAKLKAMIPPENIAYAKKVLADNGVPELPAGIEHEGDYLIRSTAATARRHVEIALKHPLVRLVANALGAPPADVTAMIKESGRLLAGLCGEVSQAKRHAAAGVDIIIAQGTEGGGHTGEIGSMVLWPEVVDAVAPVPVLGAGGVGSGAQIAAALMLGAQGVWTGSLWLTTVESDLTDQQRELLIEARSRDTTRSKSLTGKPCRMLKNEWTKAWEAPSAPKTLPLPLQDIVAAEATGRARAYPDKAKAVTINPVGQIVGRLNTIERTRDVIYRLIEEYYASTERFRPLMIWE